MNDRSRGGGRRAFVTGASTGIGAATAMLLAGEGYDLVLPGRSADGLAEVKSQVEARGQRAHARNLDLRDPGAIDAAIAFACNRKCGRTQMTKILALSAIAGLVLVASSAANGRGGPLVEVTVSTLRLEHHCTRLGSNLGKAVLPPDIRVLPVMPPQT